MTSPQPIETLFDDLMVQVFTINQTDDYLEITDKIIKLAALIIETETDESTWSIGESGEACLPDFIVGAFWHYSEWHGGQGSQGYLALSRLGEIFSPGMTSTPEEGDSEHSTYDQLNQLAKEN